MFHDLFAGWFHLIRDWHYAGVFVLMAIESTVFPLPSELVIPPAAYWATQGEMHFWGVVVAATLGSWAGSAISYGVARSVGRPMILRYGRYVLVPEAKWLLAERWIHRYSTAGVFFARLLPVVRHLVSLPAGAARMPFLRFSVTTLAGSFLWSAVLAWFGARVLADQPGLLADPDALGHLLRARMWWFIAAVLVLLGLYVAVDLIGRRLRREAATEPRLG
ncbi:MAG TPA: DedA family protein [Candidatus Eisenbacteria bacterium]|jgi:membrane protein DedA with SNARE-associated domain